MIGSGAFSGGLGAELTGGNFWSGFRNGAISSALNHVAHIDINDEGVRAKQHVDAVREFLIAEGYGQEQVFRDVSIHDNKFYKKNFAKLSGFENYRSRFKGGIRDSHSGTHDAWVSKNKYSFGWRPDWSRFALKYYPSREHSIGIVQPGIAHLFEYSATRWLGYDMHIVNSVAYSFYRRRSIIF